MNSSQNSTTKAGYNRFLLLVAGLGGLLYGIDVGIISGALPYLQDTFTLPNGGLLSSQQISLVVAAVLLGTVISTLFAGALADRFGAVGISPRVRGGVCHRRGRNDSFLPFHGWRHGYARRLDHVHDVDADVRLHMD